MRLIRAGRPRRCRPRSRRPSSHKLFQQALKSTFKDRLLIITPGIRPVGSGGDDQKRTVDVAQAFANGADYIVVGRPIRDAADPRAAAEAIQDSIKKIKG